jgi:hypothetical protein
MKRTLDYYLLWLVVIISVALNVYIISVLREVRRQVGIAAGNAAVGVGQLADGAIDYNVEIHESLPVSMTIGYEDQITVPISVTLPISTEVEVPLRTPLGVFPIVVPVITSFPVRLNPVIPISVELPISTTVPVNVDFPIHVEIRDTAFGTSLDDAQVYLENLARDLGATGPFSPTVITVTATPQQPQ